MKVNNVVVGFIMVFVGSACANFPEIADISNQNDSNTAEASNTSPPDNASASQSSEQGAGSTPTGAGSEPAEPLIDPQGLVLNEILYDVPGSDTDGVLFVELYAQVGGNLEGYGVRFVNGGDGKITDRIDLPAGTEIGDAEFFVIADGRTGALDTTQVSNYNFIDNFDPQNGPDGVQLIDRNHSVIDSVVYGTGGVNVSDDGLSVGEGLPALDVESGWSLTRTEPGLDTDDNETDFIGIEVPTPGE